MTKAYFFNEGKLYFATNAHKWLTCNKTEELESFIHQAEKETKLGRHVLGYLSYEASMAFDDAHKLRFNDKLAPAAFASFDEIIELKEIPIANEELLPVQSTPLIEKEEYCQAVEKALSYIKNGDIYQVNYTFRCSLELKNSPEQLFLHLIKNHPVPYAAYIEIDNLKILSLSPELFLSKRNSQLTTKPMKGTSKRSGLWKKDEQRRLDLSKCQKSRSENIMIVDLMRNDLSRICSNVKATNLFEVSRYASLHQMTGTVHGELRDKNNLHDILKATYPPGSITGAPKIRAMEIINELESSPRGVYTGSIFQLYPNGDFDFNVCIRTIECHPDETLLGIGSGIVADSGSGPEWNECLLKSSFLNMTPPPDEVFTTFLWSKKDGYNNLDRHINRLDESCRWLLRKFNQKECLQFLDELNNSLTNSSEFAKVRVSVGFSGNLNINYDTIQDPKWDDIRVGLYLKERINSKDPYLFHKTSHRDIYDRAYQYAKKHNYDEVLLLNENDQICEGSISTLKIINNKGKSFVPKLKSGLLPSVSRQIALESENVKEKFITLKDLKNAKKIFLGNSLRGWAKVNRLDIP